eukprot:scaffold165816_cov33-Tisochrysis_lutea.AAC.2
MVAMIFGDKPDAFISPAHLTKKPSCREPMSRPSVPTVHACIDKAAAKSGAALRMAAMTSTSDVNKFGASITTPYAPAATMTPSTTAKRMRRRESRRAARGASDPGASATASKAFGLGSPDPRCFEDA